MSRTLLTLVLVAIAVFLSPSIFGQQNQPLEDGTHLNRSIQQAPGMNAPPVRSEDEATQQMLQNHRKFQRRYFINISDSPHFHRAFWINFMYLEIRKSCQAFTPF